MMNFCTLIFCFLMGRNIGIGAVNIIKNHEQVSSNLDDQTRWAKELSEFQTGLKYHNVDVSVGRAAPTASEVNSHQIQFLLYTKRNHYSPDILTLNNLESLQNSHINPQERTIFVTHGWLNSAGSESCVLIREAYLRSHHNPNVIVIDWSPIASNLWYPGAAAKVPIVGTAVAIFINYLAYNRYLTISDTILVGHSLGAHVVGIAGFRADGTPRAVFGLDPALPLFRFASPGYRISNRDATHVQIIHTNAGLLGTNEFWGDVSFLMNGGLTQEGCFLDPITCSHSRAYQYFAESITSTVGFYGGLCSTPEEVALGACFGASGRMGGYLPHDALENGEIFTVPVNMNSPFAHGESLQAWRPFGTRSGRRLPPTYDGILRS